MTDAELKAVRNKIKENTKAWAITNGYIKDDTAPSEISPLGKKFKSILLTRDFGCHKQAVIEILSAISGDSLSVEVKSPGLTSLPLVAVVPLSNTNSHNYKIGVPFITPSNSSVALLENNRAVRLDGTAGNSPERRKETNRPATAEEIDAMPDIQIENAAVSIIFL